MIAVSRNFRTTLGLLQVAAKSFVESEVGLTRIQVSQRDGDLSPFAAHAGPSNGSAQHTDGRTDGRTERTDGQTEQTDG